MTGFRHVAELFGQVEQSGLVLDDLVCGSQHRGVPCFEGLVRTTIKTGNHHLQQEMYRFLLSSLRREQCQIKSELIQIIEY